MTRRVRETIWTNQAQLPFVKDTLLMRYVLPLACDVVMLDLITLCILSVTVLESTCELLVGTGPRQG